MGTLGPGRVLAIPAWCPILAADGSVVKDDVYLVGTTVPRTVTVELVNFHRGVEKDPQKCGRIRR